MQNTPHNLSKHPSMSSVDAVTGPSPSRTVSDAAAAAAGLTGARSSTAGKGHTASHSVDSVTLLDHRSTPGSTNGGLQPQPQLSVAGNSETGMLHSTTTNGGRFSTAGVSSSLARAAGLSAGIR